jgi:spoIIIJ-associated protein
MEKEQIIQEINELFEKLSVPISSVDVQKQGDMCVYNIVTPDSGMMIGRNGEHLQALNHVVSLMVSRKSKAQVRFNLDVNNYRQNELNEMKAEVRKTADDVLKSKVSQELRPMTSYERLVVHNLLTDDIEVETESVGEGKERRIVIKYMEL